MVEAERYMWENRRMIANACPFRCGNADSDTERCRRITVPTLSGRRRWHEPCRQSRPTSGTDQRGLHASRCTCSSSSTQRSTGSQWSSLIACATWSFIGRSSISRALLRSGRVEAAWSVTLNWVAVVDRASIERTYEPAERRALDRPTGCSSVRFVIRRSQRSWWKHDDVTFALCWVMLSLVLAVAYTPRSQTTVAIVGSWMTPADTRQERPRDVSEFIQTRVLIPNQGSIVSL